MNEIDLHTHTTASDGTLDPAQLVALAASKGLRSIAVTDHDSTEGISWTLEEAKKYDLEIIPGIELGTDTSVGQVHILGYFIDLGNRELRNELKKMCLARVQRAEKMLSKLAALGYPISWSRVVGLSDNGLIGRPHIAQVMTEQGYVSSVREAFDKYIGREGPAYVERPYKLKPPEAVKLIVHAGGLPVLAHPLSYDRTGKLVSAKPLSLLPDLRKVGLVGLEAYYSGYPAQASEFLSRVADRHLVVTTGGSDFHGSLKPESILGGVSVPAECVEKLKRLARRSQ